MKRRIAALAGATAFFAVALVEASPHSRPRRHLPRSTGVTAHARVVEPRAALLPDGIRRRTGRATTLDGVEIHYEVAGEGPAIVFVHGLGGNHAVWFQQVADFAADHTVVTFSQRGFAPSGGDRHAYDARVLAEDLAAVLDAAGVPRAVLVGQSMGGWTALRFAVSHPDRVEALVLADTTAGIRDATIDRHLAAMVEAAGRLRATPPPLGRHPALGPSFSRENPGLAVLYQSLAGFGSPAPPVIASQLAAATVADAEIAALRAPVLFVFGEFDDVFPPDVLRRAAARVPRATIHVVERTGHSPYFEAPSRWNATVRSFLGREAAPGPSR